MPFFKIQGWTGTMDAPKFLPRLPMPEMKIEAADGFEAAKVYANLYGLRDASWMDPAGTFNGRPPIVLRSEEVIAVRKPGEHSAEALKHKLHGHRPRRQP